MNATHPTPTSSAAAGLAINAEPPQIRRVVFGTTPDAVTGRVADRLRIDGLEVLFARSAEAARRYALGRTDTAVVVPVAFDADGGLLATAKVVTALPRIKVVIWAPHDDERLHQFAELIGAVFVSEDGGADQLWSAIVE